MALTVPNGPTSFYDADIHDLPLYEVHAKARDGNIAAIHRLHDGPTFTATAKTTDNTAASQVIDLTDEGLTFPAGAFRKVRFKSTARTDNDVWIQEWEQWVWGNDGTTPKLVGSPKLLNAVGEINGTVVQYGDTKVTYPVVDGALGTIVSEHSSAGHSIDGIDNGNGVLTHPIARATVGARVRYAHFAADVETIGERRHIQVVSQATAATATVSISTINGTEAVGVPTDDGELEIGMFILPPPSIALVMTSNNLEVHCGHDASDDVYHDVEVFVGPTEHRPVVAD